MRPEEQLRERITMALQSRHATDSVRVTTNGNTFAVETNADGMSTALRTYLFLERAMVELDGINQKVADVLRDRMDTIWHALTDSERAQLDDRTGGLWGACAEVGLGHERTTVAWHESEIDALAALAVALGLDAEGNEQCPVVYRIRANAALIERDDYRMENERLTAERDAARADVQALRLAAQAYFTTIDNAPTFGAGEDAVGEHNDECARAAHTLAVLAGARGPR